MAEQVKSFLCEDNGGIWKVSHPAIAKTRFRAVNAIGELDGVSSVTYTSDSDKYSLVVRMSALYETQSVIADIRNALDGLDQSQVVKVPVIGKAPKDTLILTTGIMGDTFKFYKVPQGCGSNRFDTVCVMLPNGLAPSTPMSVAKLHYNDAYDAKTGVRIALARALDLLGYERELKVSLINSTLEKM